ncbi:MAG: glutamyl-tRNA reductase [Candidatus Zixiibacteriota bacterium]
MQFGIIGTSIWQQNMPLLERLTLERGKKHTFLAELKQVLGLNELLYLATCNRVEFMYAINGEDQGERPLHRLIDFFFAGQHDVGFFPNDFYHLTGREAITHLFRTVASLESLVVGETQITGQFKQAWQDSAADGLSGPVLADLAEKALQIARKVKRETSVGEGALSMASLAASELQRHLQANMQAVVALVGTGAMTRKLASYIKDFTLGDIVFVNRTLENARPLAQEFGGTAVSLEVFLRQPTGVDAIISATAASEPVFDCTFLDRLTASTNPVLCIDLAVPRDFSIEFERDSRVRFIDIPILKSRCNGNLRQKFVEVGKASEIVREAVNSYLSGRMELSLKPIFHDSYKESLELADRALNDLFAQKLTSLQHDEREAVKRLVTKLIGHSSFQPVRVLSERLAQMRSGLCPNDLGGAQ